MTKRQRDVVIRDEKYGLPYSKGLMASSVMATGLSPVDSYEVARLIENYLREKKILSLSVEELREITLKILREKVGEDYAQRYLRWQNLGKIDKPLIILIGGTTGVGKSTIATEVAHRLGITRIVSTDALREVMRAIFSKELMPALYESSFNAWRNLKTPLSKETDPLIVGFQEQVQKVAVGVQAMIQRAITEGLNMVIEGIHIVPGFINPSRFKEAFIVPVVITVENEELHRSHFYIRKVETNGFRPFERYRANFENIRRLGAYIETLAQEKEVPIISSDNWDFTVSAVMEEILERVIIPETDKVAR